MKKQAVLSILVFIALVGAGTAYRVVRASDHDDGENDAKSRTLNLTDHYVWKDTTDATKINFVQTSNPRSLPGYQYYFSTLARYEIHVTRVADKTKSPTGSDDMTFRFQFGQPDSTGAQAITLTVLKSGAVVGSDASAKTTPITAASATATSVTIGGVAYKLFAGLREDTFFFDVQRYFSVRNFLASAFFGGVAATTPLATFQSSGNYTCDGNYFLKNVTGYDTTGGTGSGTASASNGDPVHLFNPPSCAEDFTKNYNRNEIELQAPITALQASNETVFDTWSTISIPQ